MTTCVCIFAKPPRPGLVKTRLASSLGDELSAKLAGAFLKDVWALAHQLEEVRVILATTDPTSLEDGLGEIERWDQGEGELGHKLQRVLERGLREHGRVMALGGDSPDLPLSSLHSAIVALDTNDAVICPAQDGGFVLLALKVLPSAALHELPWSASTTCQATVNRLRQLGLSVFVLKGWDDVDDEADLQQLTKRLLNGGLASHTSRVLTDSGLLNER